MSQQINLFNPDFLKIKKYFSTRAILQAMGLIVIGSIFFYGYAVYQVNALARQSEDTGKRYAVEQIKFANFSNEFSAEKNINLLQEDLKHLEAEAASQREILDTLKSGAIGNTEGYSEYMRAFARQVVHGLWLNGFEITGDGTQMSLSGGVVNPHLVPSYIQRLSKEKVMRGTTFAALQMQQPKALANKPPVTTYVEFSMQSTEAHGTTK
jgi:hypothetical protein